MAVNAGSDEISVLAVTEEGLECVSKTDSGGVRPNSIVIYENLVYVLNAGGSGNLAGFWLSGEGELSHIAGSTRHVSNLGLDAAPLLALDAPT